MQTKGSQGKVEQLVKSVLAPQQLELKKGAEVMFVANNYQQGFANGSRGHVVGFRDGQPLVELSDGRQIKVEPHAWVMEEDGRKTAEAVQLPLRLAWAITIHKSQGMSLDAAEIDLSRSFTPGMGYVALSRVRSLEGVYLGGINNMALAMHPQIFEFDVRLREASEELADTVEDLPEEEEAPASGSEEGDDKPKLPVHDDLFNKLKQWRFQRAQRDKTAPYIIAHNSHLEAIAAKPPATAQQLLAIPGFGPKKLETYGEEIIGITAPYAQATAGDGQPAITDDKTDNNTEGKAVDIVKDVPQAAPKETAAPQYPRTGKHWSPDEDAVLLELFSEGRTLQQVCVSLERPPEDIWSRLRHIMKS
jgi:hypothetical protein